MGVVILKIKTIDRHLRGRFRCDHSSARSMSGFCSRNLEDGFATGRGFSHPPPHIRLVADESNNFLTEQGVVSDVEDADPGL